MEEVARYVDRPGCQKRARELLFMLDWGEDTQVRAFGAKQLSLTHDLETSAITVAVEEYSDWVHIYSPILECDVNSRMGAVAILYLLYNIDKLGNMQLLNPSK